MKSYEKLKEAKRLVERFRETVDSYRPEEEACHCAVVAVEEIINVLNDLEYCETGKVNNSMGQDNWTEIKDAIKNYEYLTA